jgi:hypothetical protein
MPKKGVPEMRRVAQASGAPKKTDRRAWGRIDETWNNDWRANTYRRAKLKRYYCPGCGMVRNTQDTTYLAGENVVAEIVGDRVTPHYRTTGPAVGEKDVCSGGTIDLEKDRAP